MKRLSKSPTVANCKSHNARRSTPRNNRIRREAVCGPTRPQHTSQKNMSSRAVNFNCHDTLRTSLSSNTQPPLVSNTADHAWPMPTAPPIVRQRGNTLSAAHEFASDGESTCGISIPTVATCVERSWYRKGHARPNTSSETLRKCTKQTCL